MLKRKTINCFVWGLAIHFVALILLSSCLFINDPAFLYEGEHPELEATMICSVPGTKSNVDDQILVLEEDEYGRVLFAHMSHSSFRSTWNYQHSMLSLCIMQKCDDQTVWILRNQNALFIEIQSVEVLDLNIIKKYYSDDTISNLKLHNDWGNPSFSPALFPVTYQDDLSLKGAEYIDPSDYEIYFGDSLWIYPMYQDISCGYVCFFAVSQKNDAGNKELKSAYLVLLNKDLEIEDISTDVCPLRGISDFQEDYSIFINNALKNPG